MVGISSQSSTCPEKDSIFALKPSLPVLVETRPQVPSAAAVSGGLRGFLPSSWLNYGRLRGRVEEVGQMGSRLRFLPNNVVSHQVGDCWGSVERPLPPSRFCNGAVGSCNNGSKSGSGSAPTPTTRIWYIISVTCSFKACRPPSRLMPLLTSGGSSTRIEARLFGFKAPSPRPVGSITPPYRRRILSISPIV